jgi:Mg-chelatase subunit ChlD
MGGGGSVELDSRVSNADLSLSLDALGAVAANQPITGTAVDGRVSGRRGESADATKALIVGGIMVDSNGNQAASSVSGGEIMDSKQLSDRGRLPAVVAGTPPASPEPASAESSSPTAPTDLFAMGMGEVDGERSARERSRAAQQPAGVELRELQEALKSTEAIRGIIRQQESKLQSQIVASDKDKVVEQLKEQYKAPDAAAMVEFQTESLSGELDKLNGLIESRESNVQRYRNGHWGGMAGRATATPQPAKPESASQGLQGGSRQRWDIRKEADDFAGEGQAGADVSRDFYSYAEGRDGAEASVLEGEVAEGLMLGVPLERRLKMLGTDQSNGEADADGKPTNEYIRGKRAGIPLGWSKADISFENNVDFDIAFERDGQVIAGKDIAVTSRQSKSSKGLKKKAPAAPKQDAERAAGLNETSASEEPFSTFSLHVSDVAFKLARTALSQGQWPAADKVRIEEFVNALDYSDPNPSQDSKVACQLEQCVHPFLQQRNLMRVSMRTAASGRTMATPLSLTLVLDHSGSMERADRRQLLTEALSALAKQLKPTDKVTLISFARTPRLVAEQVAGNQTGQLLQQVIQQPIEGGTNLEAALELAYEKARESHRSGTFQSRIVLLTDGAVNLGDADPESLQKRVIQMRQSGIAFDAAGISANGLNDEVLETLTRKGDGRYYLIDGLDGSDDRFAQQVAGALRPAAKNVKVQVEFNPQRVGQYKLLGFEKHALKKEDFRNDKVDAAEMAAEEAGVAVYQFQVKPDGQGDIGSVSVRFQDLETGRVIEQRWPIPYQSHANEMEQAAPSMQLAAAAALFAAKLRGDGIGQTVDLKELYRTLQALPSSQRSAPRVTELIQMIQQAELIQ